MANERPTLTSMDSALLRGIDSESMLRAGRPAFEEDQSSFSDVITKGIPLTGAAIVNSFINTPAALMRTLGMDAEPTISMGDWGFDSETLSYYQDNRAAIEGAALVAGSFIPGLASLKLLKAAQQGKIGGQMVQAATGIFAAREAKYTAAAIDAIKAGEATLFSAVRGDMLKAIGFGFGEQALQAAVWEVATVATMKGNYALEDLSLSDVAWNIGKGAAVGGIIGGALGSLTTTGKIKGAFVDKELSERMYELFDLNGQLKILAGDKVNALWSSMLDVADTAGPLTSSASSKFAAAQRHSIGKMTEMLGEVAAQDHRLAFELTHRMQEHVDQLYLQFGKEKAAELLDNVFSGVKRIGRVSEDMLEVAPTPTHMLRFERGQDDFIKGFFKKDEAHVGNFVHQFDPANVADDAVYFTSKSGLTPQVSLQGVHAKNSKEAFDAGFDVFITKRGNVMVKDADEVMQVPAPGRNRGLSVKEASARTNVGVKETSGVVSEETAKLSKAGYLNLATGEVFDEPFKHFTIADKGTVELVANDAMRFGSSTVEKFSAKLDDATTWLAEQPAIEVSKRWAWAAAHSAEGKGIHAVLGKADAIDAADLPLFEMAKAMVKRNNKLLELDQLDTLLPSVKYVDDAGNEVQETFGAFISSKLPGLQVLDAPADAIDIAIGVMKQELFEKLINKGASLDEIAIKLNLDQSKLANLEFQSGQLADYVRPVRMRLDYDISQVFAQDGNIVRGRVDQMLRIQQAHDRAKTVAAAFFKTRFDAVSVEKVGAENATSLGAGQGMLTSANEDALTLGGRMKYMGAQIHALKQELHQETASQLKEAFLDVVKSSKAGAELAALRAQMQRTGEQYMVFTAQDAKLLQTLVDNGSDFGAKQMAVEAIANGGDGAVVLATSSMTDIGKKTFKFSEMLLPNEPGFVLTGGADAAALAAKNQAAKNAVYVLETKEAATALRASSGRAAQRSGWDEAARDAMGRGRRNPWIGTELESNTVYFPPVATERYQHYKFVRAVHGDVLEGGEQTTMIFGRTAEELLEKEQLIDKTKYQVLSREEVRDFHKYMGDYSADLDMSSLFVKSDLKKSGVLADKYPRMNIEEMMTDMLSWHQKADSRLVHQYAELANPDLFAQLRSLGDQWKSAMQSKFPSKNADTLSNPFDSYIKLGLDIAQKDKMPDYFRWQQFAEDKASSAIQGVMKMFGAGKPTAEQYQEATDALARMGMGNPYAATLRAGMEMKAFEGAISMVPKQYLAKFTNAVNATVATLGIRLDVIQSAINAISTPVMLVMQTEAAKLGALDDLKVKVPGSKVELPGTSKLMYQAMKDVTTGADRKALIARYEKLGTVRAKSAEFVDLYDEIALPVHPTVEALEAKVAKLADMGARATLSDQAEVFTRALASRTAELLYSKLGYTGKDLDSLIYTFSARVNGNHLTSQRPLAFQGWLGQSVGLYQTYQFNLLQQMFRNVQTGKPKSVLYALGMQQTLFGMQGLPGFQAINQHIIGNAEGNWKHHDMYTAVPSYFSKDVGEFLLYGGVASLTRSGVYSRGDISPRNITVLPVLPTDWPGLSVLTRSLDNLHKTVQVAAGGGDLGQTFFQALEHNGMNRMIQGLAVVAAGQSTTSGGSLLSVNRPPDAGLLDMVSISNAVRILGARPFDEAIALDENYRKLAYQMADSARMEKLGKVAKSKMISGDELEPDEIADIATKYAAAGGRLETFGRKLVAWEKDAHRSVANQAFYGAQTPISQRAQAIMGGRQLPDYRNTWQEPEAEADQEAMQK